MICVDPYLKIDDNDHKTLLQNNEESNFDRNISICKNNGKITIHKITSDDFFSINKNDVKIAIRGDVKTPYSTVKNVIDILQKQNLNRFLHTSMQSPRWFGPQGSGAE